MSAGDQTPGPRLVNQFHPRVGLAVQLRRQIDHLWPGPRGGTLFHPRFFLFPVDYGSAGLNENRGAVERCVRRRLSAARGWRRLGPRARSGACFSARFPRAEMGRIWSDENKFRMWLEVE